MLRLPHTLWRSEKIEISIKVFLLPASYCESVVGSSSDNSLFRGQSDSHQSRSVGTVSVVLRNGCSLGRVFGLPRPMKYRSARRFLKVGVGSLGTVEPLEVIDGTVQQIEALALVRPAKSGQFILTVYSMHKSCATSGRDSFSRSPSH